MQILSSQVQSTLLRSSSFKLQINLNVLSLDMKYVSNIFEKNANFPVWAVFHKTYVIRWFERKKSITVNGIGKNYTTLLYFHWLYFWHLGTYSSKAAIFYKSIGIAEQRKREAKLGAVKFESLKFSSITFIFQVFRTFGHLLLVINVPPSFSDGMKPFLITILILVAIAAATATPKKYERRPMNYFGKVSIIFSVFCSFSVSFSMIF